MTGEETTYDHGWRKDTLNHGGETVCWQEMDPYGDHHEPLALVTGYADGSSEDNRPQDQPKTLVPEKDREELRELVSQTSELNVSKDRVNFWEKPDPILRY